MSNEIYRNIFQILKSFIFDEVPDLDQVHNWDDIFYYSKIHSLVGTVGYVVTKYKLCDDHAYAGKFEQAVIERFGYQYRRNKQMERLISVLNEKGIDHLLMKGYIVKDLYPVPELRSYGDIDFVIKKEDRERTDSLMKELNYESNEQWEPVYSYKKDTEYYEIHTEMLDSEINDGTQREYFRDFWTHAIKTDEHTYVLDKEYHFLYLIAHLAKHASRSGAGLRMYLDIALYIKEYRKTLNWDYVLGQLDVLNLKQFFYTVCNACDDWFAVEPPCHIEPIDTEVLEQFTEMTMRGGTFGYYDSNDAIAALKESHVRDSKFKTIAEQIFPPAGEIESRYKYLQKHKWLLPVAWVDRVIRNRKLITKRINTAKDILELDNKEINKVLDLNKKIGL